MKTPPKTSLKSQKVGIPGIHNSVRAFLGKQTNDAKLKQANGTNYIFFATVCLRTLVKESIPHLLFSLFYHLTPSLKEHDVTTLPALFTMARHKLCPK
jgi:hypothetical protein